MAGDDAVSPITGAAVNGVTPVNVNGAVYGLPIGAEGYDVMSNRGSRRGLPSRVRRRAAGAEGDSPTNGDGR